MLKIGEVTKSCHGRGKNSWLKKELVLEAQRRGIRIKSSWTKEQICDAIFRQEGKEVPEEEEEKKTRRGEQTEQEKKETEVKEKSGRLEYKDGGAQFFAEEALKLGYNFKKLQKFKTYTVYFATHFHPLKFREESKIRITRPEVKELLQSNDFRVKEGEEFLRKFLRLFSLEIEIVDEKELPKEPPLLPTKEIQLWPCVYTKREFIAFGARYVPPPGAVHFDAYGNYYNFLREFNKLLGVFTDLERFKPWEENSLKHLLRHEIYGDRIPPVIPREKMLWIRTVTQHGPNAYYCDHSLMSVEDVNRSLEEKKTYQVTYQNGQVHNHAVITTLPVNSRGGGPPIPGIPVVLEVVHYHGFDKICMERMKDPDFAKLFRLLSISQVTAMAEILKREVLTDVSKELLFTAAQNGADIKELGLRDVYRKVRAERIADYSRALNETPMARDTVGIVEGFLAKPF